MTTATALQSKTMASKLAGNMNNRINELAVQAGGIWQGGYVEQANGDSVYTDKKFVSGSDMDVEQFARLLVKECMTVARGADGLDATHEAWYLIQEHFGGKE
jgi:hypothetical protein